MRFEAFEDIVAWQRARALNREIFNLANGEVLIRERILGDQMKRASLSVMGNIAEGFERGGRREFVHFLSIAKASVGELRSHLYAVFDQDYISEETFLRLHDEARDIGRMLGGLLKYLRRSALPGIKFKQKISATPNSKLQTRHFRKP